MTSDRRPADPIAGRAFGMFGMLGVLFVAAAVVGACGSDDDATGAPTSAAVAEALAPSQLAASTVPTPTLASRCDPADIGVVIVEPDGGVGGPDQIIDLVNEGDRDCDVDVSATGSAAAEMEPSVHLRPGGIGHLWVEAQDDCDETLADPEVQMLLDINGEARLVDLVVVAPCGVELVAFFTD